MNARRFIMPAAALVAAATLTGLTATTAGATIIGHGFGTGPTLNVADNAARNQLNGDYFGCKLPILVIGSGQNADGTWWEEVGANCTGLR
jgi:hypothetical protein